MMTVVTVRVMEVEGGEDITIEKGSIDFLISRCPAHSSSNTYELMISDLMAISLSSPSPIASRVLAFAILQGPVMQSPRPIFTTVVDFLYRQSLGIFLSRAFFGLREVNRSLSVKPARGNNSPRTTAFSSQ